MKLLRRESLLNLVPSLDWLYCTLCLFALTFYTLYPLYSPSFIIPVVRIYAECHGTLSVVAGILNLRYTLSEESVCPEMRQMSGFFIRAAQ